MKTRITELLAIENRPGGCEFKDIQPLVAGTKGARHSPLATRQKGWSGPVSLSG